MIDFTPEQTLGSSLQAYNTAWQQLVQNHPHVERVAQPTTISWKVADKAALFDCLQRLAPEADQVHIGTVNDRYIASVATTSPIESLCIVKILERRPGSSDPPGLDSVDYLVDSIEEMFDVCQTEGLAIERQQNDVHAWLSLRFGAQNQFEAKFVNHLVLKVAIKELKMKEQELLKLLDI